LCALALPAATQDFPPALVVTEPLAMMDFNPQIRLIGRSEARAESRIVAEVAGRVKRIDAAEGRWVTAGTPLVTIDSRRIKLSLKAKRAEAAQAKADADLAIKDLERAQEGFDEQVLPESNLDAALAAETRTAERFNQLDAEREQLELDHSNCTIRSPYDGYTVRYLVQVGEWVSPGTPVYEMVDLSVVKVTVDLPERRFGQVEVGSEVAIIVSGDPDNPISGKVTGIAPQASRETHTFPVIVSVENPEARLGSGMLVKATLSLMGSFSSYAVSKDAIIRQGNQTIVYTIVEGKATPVPVITTSSQGTMVAVSGEGLSDGMPVVVRGNERIFPGSPVQVPGAGGEETEESPESEEAQTEQSSTQGSK